jgi:beta-lactamase regulating signal transducer with metallopeptidase domain
MTAIAHAISEALLHFTWQGLLVGGLAWIVLAMLRNNSARVRYFVCCATLGSLTVLPVVTAWTVYRDPAAAVTTRTIDWTASESTSALPAGTSLPAWIAALEGAALPVWFAGVLMFAVRPIWISGHVARLRRVGEAGEGAVMEAVTRLARRMRVSGGVRVLVSGLAESPCVVGWLRPVILLPAAALANLSVEQLETVLAHELAHIRRHDYLVNLLQTVSETLLFYHPAVWWISARIRHERELCCDDVVVATCGDAIGYARTLTKLERMRVIAPEMVMSGTGGSLLYRIERLTGAAHEPASSKVPAVVSLALAVVCVMTASRWATGQQQPLREGVVNRNEILIGTAKRGDLTVDVRALGTMTSADTAELKVPASQADELKVGQSASILLRPDVSISGTVARIDSATGGQVAVGIHLEKQAPEFAGANVDGTVRVRVLKNVLYVGRPVFAAANTQYRLFKLEPDGSHAIRSTVRFGAASVDAIQIVTGLQPGDRVILSDMSKYDGQDRIRLQ